MGLSSDQIDQILLSFQKQEETLLHPLACSSHFGTRKHEEPKSFRPVFIHDGDRIIHSLSYARYFDKTQVFFWIQSDLHQHRMLHVQLVSNLARVVAAVLGLNQDLVESIALGHDIGHPPFGHDGERILSSLCEKNRIGGYYHNYGSVWFLQEVEQQNLSLPVLDGILGHNGEIHQQQMKKADFKTLSWDTFTQEKEALRIHHKRNLQPKTLEGILVRYIDVVSYISRDILDAENLGILKFQDIPNNVKNILGSTNREIINTLISDLISNSINQPFIGYTKDVYFALEELYKFNIEKIYTHNDKETYLPVIQHAFEVLWSKYLEDINNENQNSKIYTDHIDLNLKMIQTRSPEINSYDNYLYMQNPPEVIVRDFIAGMTDQYFWQLAKQTDPSIDFIPATIY